MIPDRAAEQAREQIGQAGGFQLAVQIDILFCIDLESADIEKQRDQA